MLRVIRYWIRAVFQHATLEREMHEEMQHHLDRRVEAIMAGGLSADEARVAARREFGNLAVHQDAGRDARRTRWVDSIRTDVRFALRFFTRKPLASATIVLVLALGIGGHAVQLSLLLAVVKRPPPGTSADVPLVRLRGMYRARNAPDWHDRSLWYAEVRQIAAVPNTFAAVAASTSSRVTASVPGAMDGETLSALFVTDNYFRTIGIRPTHGPGLPAEDDASGAQLIGVISYAMWEDVFNRADVADRVVTLNGVAIRVAGVAPPAFTGAPPVDNRRMMWLPLSSRKTVIGVSDSSAFASLDSASFEIVGLLQPGVSPARASAVARVVTAGVAARLVPPPVVSKGPAYVYDSDVVPLRGITSVGANAHMTLLLATWGILSTLVLLVVCTNVSGLAISSAVGRRQEIAVRLSLGASRGRVIRQLLTESVLLAFAGAALGLLVFRAIVAAASRIPEVEYVRPDLETFGLTMLMAAGTGILFGVAPAFHATRDGVAEALKSSGMGATRRSRMHQVFVVAQIVLTQPLLVLIASGIGALMTNDRALLPNSIPDHVAQLSVDVRSIPGPTAQKSAALRRLVQRLGETPGVEQVLPVPDLIRSTTLSVRAEDRGPLARANDPIQVDMMLSKTGYFALLGVPLLRGNDLPPADTGMTAIISSDLARALWGSADPIGRRFRQIVPAPSVQRDLVVSGVYDSRHLPSGETRAVIYRAVNDWPAQRYLIRTTGPATDLIALLRRVARAELPSNPIEPPRTLAQIDATADASENTARLAAVACATLVLLLASIGLYGIVAISVGQRRREIGVRMALGAGAVQVVELFYRSGVQLSALGLFIGLPGSLFAARFLPKLAEVGGNSTRGPNLVVVGGAVGAVVLVVASVATLIPASRAAAVNPVTALRAE